mmetsp:Transcript_53033/g.57565  ORF Transcript_53033/g.57565 Transcript_53033/m.57565 type:complete len:130 (+) Transcript_53033:166-555(+)
MCRQADEDIKGVSSNAYGDIRKANKVAEVKFEELAEEYLGEYKVVNDTGEHYSAKKDEDNNEEEYYGNIVTLSHDKDDEKKCWSWKFVDSGPEEYYANFKHKGTVFVEPIRVIEHDGIFYKQSTDINIL